LPGTRSLARILAVGVALAHCADAARARVYRNSEYGIRADFPAGARVCTALSGGHPVGFHARLDGPTDCVNGGGESDRIALVASYNSAFEAAPKPGCPDRGRPLEAGLLKGLAFPHRRSVVCGVRGPEGSVTILVSARGGRWTGPGLPAWIVATPLIDYVAVLNSGPKRFQTNLRTFRAFLKATSLGWAKGRARRPAR